MDITVVGGGLAGVEAAYQLASDGGCTAVVFNRLFRRKVLMSPTQYRRRFGALRSRLREARTALGA